MGAAQAFLCHGCDLPLCLACRALDLGSCCLFSLIAHLHVQTTTSEAGHRRGRVPSWLRLKLRTMMHYEGSLPTAVSYSAAGANGPVTSHLRRRSPRIEPRLECRIMPYLRILFRWKMLRWLSKRLALSPSSSRAGIKAFRSAHLQSNVSAVIHLLL